MKKLIKTAIPMGAAIGLARLDSALAGSMNMMLALIFFAGQKLGKLAGAVVGIVATIVSSVYCGFGPWVLPQLAMWTLAGIIGGSMKSKSVSMQTMVVFGFMFGVVMDTFSFFVTPMGYPNVIAQIAGGLPFDIRYCLVSTVSLAGFYAVEYGFNKVKSMVKSKLAYQAN